MIFNKPLMPARKPLAVHVNDQVAVLRRAPFGSEIVTIAKVVHLGDIAIETSDGQFFSVSDGENVGCRMVSYIEPATIAHWAALRWNRPVRLFCN